MSRNAKLIIIRPDGEVLELRLHQGEYILGRPSPKNNFQPDIDFTPDYFVSKKHARLFFRNDQWRLEDLGSKHGTFIDEQKIPDAAGSIQLKSGTSVRIGETVWSLISENRQQAAWQQIEFEFSMVPAINYALHHCGVPVISHLLLRNTAAVSSVPFSFSVSIPGYSENRVLKIPALLPAEQYHIGKIALKLHYEILSALQGRKKAQLKFYAETREIINREIFVLGFYEWSYDENFRKTLSCFIQPSHPTVQQLIFELFDYLKKNRVSGVAASITLSEFPLFQDANQVENILSALYRVLQERFHIHYFIEENSYERTGQVIRPPHKVITRFPQNENEKGEGIGTCIDLTLLFAACLENLRLQPLVIFVKEDDYVWHSFLGCWHEAADRSESVIIEQRKLLRAVEKEELCLLETTGISGFWSRQLNYAEASNLAVEILQTKEFVFALDVAATRPTITPLQFPFNPAVNRILLDAGNIAREEKSSRLKTAHLFRSFLQNHQKKVAELIKQANQLELKDENEIKQPGEQKSRTNFPKPTINYRRTLEDACLISFDTGAGFVEVDQLLYALLLSSSEDVKDLIISLGTTPAQLKAAYEQHYSRVSKEVVQTLTE